jgi:GTP-binding protein
MTDRDPLEDYETLNRELAQYDERLAALPQVVALNKIDVAMDSEAVIALEKELVSRGCTVFQISAAAHTGLRALIYHVMERLEKLRAEQKEQDLTDETLHIVAPMQEDEKHWEARQVEAHLYEVVGKGIERMVAMTDMGNDYAVRRLQRSLDKIGITRKLKLIGAKHGDSVRIRDVEFEYEDEDRFDEEMEGEAAGAGRKQV